MPKSSSDFNNVLQKNMNRVRRKGTKNHKFHANLNLSVAYQIKHINAIKRKHEQNRQNDILGFFLIFIIS